MKTFARLSCLSFLLICPLLIVGGCETTPEQRMEMAEKWLDQGKQWSEALDQAIAASELVLEQVTVALAEPNLPDSVRTKYGAIREDALNLIASFRGRKAMIDADVVTLQGVIEKARTEGNGVISEMELYSAGLTVVGRQIGGQTGGYVTLAGTLLGAIAGALGGLLKDAKSRQTLAGVVSSVTALLGRMKPEDAEAAKAALAENQQTAGVETAVRKLLGKTS